MIEAEIDEILDSDNSKDEKLDLLEEVLKVFILKIEDVFEYTGESNLQDNNIMNKEKFKSHAIII